MQLVRLFVFAANILLIGMAMADAEEYSMVFRGDVGFGTYYTGSVIRGKGDSVKALPYADFEYGRLFERVDTLGIKAMPIGNGDLELVGRISMDGFKTDASDLRGLENRKTSLPLGIGTLQITPLGGFIFNAFHDVRKSKGQWLEAIYAGEFDLPKVALYPLLGEEYQSTAYVRYYYGISAQEAALSQYAAYDPGGSYNCLIGLIADMELTAGYHLNLYLRRKLLGGAIRESPIVGQRYLDTGYLALSYRFK